jgi:hypothetical protein
MQLIVNPADAKDYPDALVAQPIRTMEELSKAADAGVTPAGQMAVALTITRNRNARVAAGTALASPIYAGLDHDLEPEHKAARQDARRKARKAQRTARKAHR